jgi:hypothetical protein
MMWDTCIRILSHHFGDFGRDHFAFLAPCCCAFEDGDAFVHDGFEVFGFGVQGGDGWGGHCEGFEWRDWIGRAGAVQLGLSTGGCDETDERMMS